MKTATTNDIVSIISYDFKHPDTVSDYEKAIFNVYKERQLKDMATQVFINRMFSDSRAEEDIKNIEREPKRFFFLGYVYTYLNIKLQSELPSILATNDIHLKANEQALLLFKGGNMMYYKYEELSQLLDDQIKTMFKGKFDKFFEISDFDFAVYIIVKDMITFHKVKKFVSQILWSGLNEIRDFFEKYLKKALISDTISSTLQSLQINSSFTDGDNNIDVFLNKVMKVQDDAITMNDDNVLTQRELKLKTAKLRSYIYFTQVAHKKPELLSEHFNKSYDKMIEQRRMSVIVDWNKIKGKYVDVQRNTWNLKDVVQNTDLLTKLNVQGLIRLYEYIILFEKYKDNLLTNDDDKNDIQILKKGLSVFIKDVMKEFASQMQIKLVMSNFYDTQVITNMKADILKDITEKYRNAESEFKVCKSVYDEYLSFNNNIKELETEENYNMIKWEHMENLEVNTTPRKDFYIQPSLLQEPTMFESNSPSNYHYLYQNSTIKKVRNDFSSIIDFDLLRIKFNFTIEEKDKDGSKINIPSEFIDISVCGYDDTSLTKFRNHYTESLSLFSIDNDIDNNKLTLECLGYSTKFMIHDLTHVLYEQNLFTPWTDLKYKKRIYRLSCLEMLSSIHDTSKFINYMLTLLLVWYIADYSYEFIQTKGITKSQNIEALYKKMSDNIFMNFKKYDFKQITYVLPTVIMETIVSNFSNVTEVHEEQKKTIPYPDQIIGSIVFYALMLRKYKEGETSGAEITDNVNIQAISEVMNRFRQDFLFLPGTKEDTISTLEESAIYLNDIAGIYKEMLSIAGSQQLATQPHPPPPRDAPQPPPPLTPSPSSYVKRGGGSNTKIDNRMKKEKRNKSASKLKTVKLRNTIKEKMKKDLTFF
jgi:hypothetical protein